MSDKLNFTIDLNSTQANYPENKISDRSILKVLYGHFPTCTTCATRATIFHSRVIWVSKTQISIQN